MLNSSSRELLLLYGHTVLDIDIDYWYGDDCFCDIQDIAKSECLNLQNIVIVLLFEVDNAQLKTMSVATRVGTNIRDECYMDGGGVGNTDNNKTSLAGASLTKMKTEKIGAQTILITVARWTSKMI